MGLFSKVLSAAAGPVLGAVAGGLFDFAGARGQNQANSAISQRQMDFQERMSNTSYQRSMADMRKAGLNPILAYKQGGASSPSGAGIPAVNELAGAANSARGLSLKAATIRNLQEDTVLKKQQGYTVDAQGRNFVEQSKKLEAEVKLLKEDLNSAKARAAAAVEEEKFWKSDLGKILKKIDLTGRAVNPFANSAKTLTK